MNKLKQKRYFHAGLALWKHRHEIAGKRQRLKKLADAVNQINDLGLSQYAQLFAMVLEFKPSIIIEVGRGWGNSTAVFTEAANTTPETKKVISICLSDEWQKYAVNRITKVVEKDWFSKLDARVGNFLNFNINNFIKKNDSILFFLDAHGWDVVEYMLGNIMPKIQKLPHLILVHDILDVRYSQHLKNYKRGIWKGYEEKEQDNSFIITNDMASLFEEVISLNDFAQRNDLAIHSVEHEFREKIHRQEKRNREIIDKLGKEMSSSTSSIFWFSLQEIPNQTPIFFPKINKLTPTKNRNQTLKLKNISDKPLVSIITPCFNSSIYIEECIQSVLNQDYSNIEHIIQDGGSTDGTIKLLKKYSKKYKNIIKWKSEKDNGQADGLNRALQRTTGEIILVLNADDALMPYACSWAVEHMRLNPQSAVVYGDEYIIDGKSQIIRFFTGPEPYKFEKIFCVEQVIPAQAAFIRRSALKEVGFYADTSLRTCPDYEMWVRIGLKYPMKHVYGPIAKYRWHSESEGRSIDMVDEMIKAKKTVMKRVFQNKTSKKYFHLKNRAYSNVLEWASKVSAQLGDRKKTYLLLFRSTLIYPQPHKIVRLISISLKNLRILINKIISSY